MPRILAIDYGSKRVGIAVTDPLQIIATPLTTVHSSEIIPFLTKYMQSEKVECFVVGKPLQMDGSDSESARLVEIFIHLLKKRFPEIPVARVDERFTSKIATRSLLESGLKKKDRQKKELVDVVSATLILQTYLESRT